MGEGGGLASQLVVRPGSRSNRGYLANSGRLAAPPATDPVDCCGPEEPNPGFIADSDSPLSKHSVCRN